jgi:hypothetical protein
LFKNLAGSYQAMAGLEEVVDGLILEEASGGPKYQQQTEPTGNEQPSHKIGGKSLRPAEMFEISGAVACDCRRHSQSAAA